MNGEDDELSPEGWERYREAMAAPTSRPLPSFVPVSPWDDPETLRAVVAFGSARFGIFVPECVLTLEIVAEMLIARLPVEAGGLGE